ncbi:MAG TPA: hypothetical protein VFY06_10370 [Verrucomicrobiae bacterium]|nr:hypothetical protein [Verrucomicrobiae bacterium]
MEYDRYLFRSNKGEVVVCPNEERPYLWDLRIDGKLICAAYYRSPEEAALRAYERDLGDEELNKIYVGLRVPSDICQWTRLPAFRKRVSLYD